MAKTKPKCNTRVIFQFGEEGEGGADIMIKAGVLDGVDEIYALHLDPETEIGKFAICDGAMFAGTVEFSVSFAGLSSHCARPKSGIDALKPFADLLFNYNNLNDDIKNNTLFHIGKAVGGEARNIIASSGTLDCTFRFFDEAHQELVMMRLAKFLTECDNKYNTTHKVIVNAVYPPLINSGSAVKKIKELIGVDDIGECLPRYTAEDFAFYTKKISGCMAWLGCRDKKYTHSLHSDLFGFDEKALLYGIEFFTRLVY